MKNQLDTLNCHTEQPTNKVLPFTVSDKNTSLPNIVVSTSESLKRIEELQIFVKDVMVQGVDYGLIKGFSKPSLLKPGAEKLCDAFGFSKVVDVVNRIEQWEAGIFAYEVKMTLIRKDNGLIEAEGLGSANGREAAFKHQDPYTIVNTVLKMAKKRALIDAILSATRSSGIFTQDIEDFPQSKAKINEGGEDPITKAQLQKIFRIVSDMNMPTDVAKEMMKMSFHVERSTQLTKIQASDFIQDLLCLQEVREDEQTK